mmetsp:Transcript_1873/g.7505  ORF Transcript_1873/g.7505 Transcript_1873/m.7505 type:complete len:226 (-) Transcript_1873:2070-2747(-)
MALARCAEVLIDTRPKRIATCSQTILLGGSLLSPPRASSRRRLRRARARARTAGSSDDSADVPVSARSAARASASAIFRRSSAAPELRPPCTTDVMSVSSSTRRRPAPRRETSSSNRSPMASLLAPSADVDGGLPPSTEALSAMPLALRAPCARSTSRAKASMRPQRSSPRSVSSSCRSTERVSAQLSVTTRRSTYGYAALKMRKFSSAANAMPSRVVSERSTSV